MTEAVGNDSAGGGDLVLDHSWPEPSPAPVRTIAWRLAHLTRSCLAVRTASGFRVLYLRHEESA